LQKAVAAAAARGAEFRILGPEIAINLPGFAELPLELAAALGDNVALFDYFGSAAEDTSAVAWLDRLGVEAVLVDDDRGYVAAIAALEHDKTEAGSGGLLGLDIETFNPAELPPPRRVNKNGTIAKHQPEPGKGALDPRRAEIATVQLYAGGERAFVFAGIAKDRLLRAPWLRRQWLAAHNALFETLFLRHAGVALDRPIECSMQAAGLVYGPPRSLAVVCKRVLGAAPPKALGASSWATERFSDGQLAYAAADAVEAWAIGAELLPKIAHSRYRVAYALQRDAIPATAAMQLRGLGFDRAEHARIVARWAAEREAAIEQYQAIMGETPPTTPAEIVALIGKVAAP
jgi:hypothetical protein